MPSKNKEVLITCARSKKVLVSRSSKENRKLQAQDRQVWKMHVCEMKVVLKWNCFTCWRWRQTQRVGEDCIDGRGHVVENTPQTIACGRSNRSIWSTQVETRPRLVRSPVQCLQSITTNSELEVSECLTWEWNRGDCVENIIIMFVFGVKLGVRFGMWLCWLTQLGGTCCRSMVALALAAARFDNWISLKYGKLADTLLESHTILRYYYLMSSFKHCSLCTHTVVSYENAHRIPLFGITPISLPLHGNPIQLPLQSLREIRPLLPLIPPMYLTVWFPRT